MKKKEGYDNRPILRKKRPYERPKLQFFGKVLQLTRGLSGPNADGGTSMRMET